MKDVYIEIKAYKEAKDFVTRLPFAVERSAHRSAKDTAETIKTNAITFAPKASGNLSRSIVVRPGDKGFGSWKVTINNIDPGPYYITKKGKTNWDSAKIYPIAQERGYAPHWISTKWINPAAKSNNNKGEMSILVGKFTPFMSIAYYRAMTKMGPEIQNNLYKDIKNCMRTAGFDCRYKYPRGMLKNIKLQFTTKI